MLYKVFGSKTLHHAMRNGLNLNNFKRPYRVSKRKRLRDLLGLARAVKKGKAIPTKGEYEGEAGY